MAVNELGRKRDSARRRGPIPPFPSAVWHRHGGNDGASHISVFTTTNTGGRSSIASQPNRRTRNGHYHR
jgi:hypothetical protein